MHHAVSNNSCLSWCNITWLCSSPILSGHFEIFLRNVRMLYWLIERKSFPRPVGNACALFTAGGGREMVVIQSLTSTGLPSSTRVVMSARPRMSMESRSSICLRSISLQSRKMETMLVCTATPSVCHCRSNRACRSRLLKVWWRLFLSKPKEENSTTFLVPSTTTDTCAGVAVDEQTPQMTYKVG